MIEKMINRKSERDYKDEPLDKNILDKLVEVLNTSATSVNGFQSSVIIVNNKEVKNKIFELVGWESQMHIKKNGALFTFLADLNRVLISSKITNKKYEENKINDFIISIGDAFIQATRLEAAANELNLGTCFLGAIRRPKIINYLYEILNLKGKVIPILAMSVGKIQKTSSTKPKINRVYFEKYDFDKISNEINDYDKTLKDFWKTKNIDDNYSKKVITYYESKVDNKEWQEIFDNFWFEKNI